MNEWKNKASFIMQENLTPYILEYAADKQDYFWIVSVIEIKVSKDYSYADIYVTCQNNQVELPRYLSQFSWELKSMIWRDMWARKSPTIRFKVSKNASWAQDVLSILSELWAKYDLN